MSMSQIQIPVTLELNETSVGKLAELVEGEAPSANKVAALTQEVMREVAAGAMIIPSEMVEQFRDISPDLDSPEALLQAAGQATGIVDGEMIIKWPTDPALTEPLRQRAEGNGITVQQLIKDMLDTAVAAGWFYDLQNNVRTMFFTPDEMEEICSIVGLKEVNATDIVEALRLAARIHAGEVDLEETPLDKITA